MSGLEIQHVPIISDPVGYGWRVNINSWSYFGQDFVNEKVTDVKCHLLIYTNVCFSESDSGAENPAGSGSEPKCLYTGIMFHRATDTSGKSKLKKITLKKKLYSWDCAVCGYLP